MPRRMPQNPKKLARNPCRAGQNGQNPPKTAQNAMAAAFSGELNNGRFAMFATLGIIAAQNLTGKDAVEQFGF